MIFSNARLVLPAGIQDGFELVVGEGRIAEIRPQSGAASIDLAGSFLAPGFIDMHVHGALGRDTMEASSDAFRAICDYHASGGTTSLLLTTATAPLNQVAKILQAIRDCRPAIGGIAGVHIEGPFISKAKAGAQRTEF